MVSSILNNQNSEFIRKYKTKDESKIFGMIKHYLTSKQ